MNKSHHNYYHAGLSRIEKFNINKGGLHMGGRYSALEAAARKVREMDYEDKKEALIYLHSVSVDTSMITEETFDHGSTDHWEHSIKEWQKVGIHGAKYRNEFEPDMRKSIVLCSTQPIKSILKVEVLTLDEAEDILEDMEDYYSFA